MIEPPSPLDGLEEVAPDFGATVSRTGAQAKATAVVSVPRAGGDRHDFSLELFTTGSVVFAREEPPSRLPIFCPDRHINPGGSFCLGWGSTAPAAVIDQSSARAWWTAVVRFLQLQLTANDLGVWENGTHDWAHGDAADHQLLAEVAADQLGPRFRADLADRKFAVVREAHARGTRLELRRNGMHVAKLTIGPPSRLKDSKVTCPCDCAAGAAIAECGDHADHLIAFTTEMWRWQQAEAKFLRDLARTGAVCCGTLKKCTLREAIAIESASAREKGRHARRHKPRRRPRL